MAHIGRIARLLFPRDLTLQPNSPPFQRSFARASVRFGSQAPALGLHYKSGTYKSVEGVWDYDLGTMMWEVSSPDFSPGLTAQMEFKLSFTPTWGTLTWYAVLSGVRILKTTSPQAGGFITVQNRFESYMTIPPYSGTPGTINQQWASLKYPDE